MTGQLRSFGAEGQHESTALQFTLREQQAFEAHTHSVGCGGDRPERAVEAWAAVEAQRDAGVVLLPVAPRVKVRLAVDQRLPLHIRMTADWWRTVAHSRRAEYDNSFGR